MDASLSESLGARLTHEFVRAFVGAWPDRDLPMVAVRESVSFGDGDDGDGDGVLIVRFTITGSESTYSWDGAESAALAVAQNAAFDLAEQPEDDRWRWRDGWREYYGQSAP